MTPLTMPTALQNALGFVQLIEQAPVAITLLMGPKFVIHTANKKQLELWRKEKEEVMAKPFFDIFPEAHQQDIGQRLPQVYANGTADSAIEVETAFERNGVPQTAWYDVAYEPLRNDTLEVEGVMIVSTDVTEKVAARQKAAEAETFLRQQKDQMELAIAAGGIGIWRWDAKTDTLFWSREQEALYGLPEKSFGGKWEDFLSFILPEDKPALLAKTSEATIEKADLEIVFRIVRKDGQVRWIQSCSRNYYNNETELVYMTGTNRDITAEKEVEEELRLGAQRNQLAQEAARATLYEVLLDERRTIRQDTLKQVLGYVPEEVEPTSEAWLALIHPDDRPRVNPIFDRGIKSGEGFSVEYRVRHKDGRYIWLHDRGRILCNESGRPERLVGMSLDITAQKESEQKLLELSNQQQQTLAELEALLASAPLGFAFFDREHRYVRINETLAQINGIPVQDHIGKTIEELLPVNAKAVVPILDKIAQTGEAVMNLEVTGETPKEPGVTRHWLTGFYPVKLGGSTDVIFVGAVVMEITGRKKAEEALQQSESRYATTVEASELGLWDYDLTTGKGIFYGRMAAIWGFTSNAEMSFDDLVAGIHPDDKAWERPAFAEFIVGNNGERFDFEHRIIQKSTGAVRWLKAKGRAFFNEEGVAVRMVGVNTDITDRKNAELLLRESEHRYRNLFENSPISIWEEDFSELQKAVLLLKAQGVTDFAGYFSNRKDELYHLISSVKIIDVNQASVELLNAVSKEQVMAGLQQIFVEDTLPAFLREIEIIAAGGGRFEHEAVVQTFDGKRLDVLVRIDFPQGDEYHSVKVILIDVTARKQAEKTTRESEASLRKLKEQLELSVSAGHIGLWHYDIQADVLTWSKEQQKLYGLDEGEFEGNLASFMRFLHPDDLALVAQKQKEIEEAPRSDYTYDFRIIRKDGVVRWLQARERRIYNEDGSLLYISGINIDITDQVVAREKLQEREARFRILAESLPQMIWVADEKGHSEYHNGQWQRYTGIAGVMEAWEYMIHPDDEALSTPVYQQAFSEGKTFSHEVRLKNKAGEYRWHCSVAEPIRDAGGRIVKWVGSLTDIHDQKTLAQQLEKLVAERTSELQRSNEDLQRFAHVSSHDLKEPVRKVLTFVSRLKDEFGSGLPERAQNYIYKIDSAARRSNAMIDGVLHYSLLSSYEQQREPVDLQKVLEAILDDLEVVIQQKGATIKTERLPVYNGYASLLYQLLYNLLINALKFSKPEVAPLVVIEARQKSGAKSESNLLKERSYLQLTLQDNGIGFPQADAEKVFKVFSRLHSKDVYEGSGMGLALCKKIAERHEGLIFAESEEGKGTRFTVMLPL